MALGIFIYAIICVHLSNLAMHAPLVTLINAITTMMTTAVTVFAKRILLVCYHLYLSVYNYPKGRRTPLPLLLGSSANLFNVYVRCHDWE